MIEIDEQVYNADGGDYNNDDEDVVVSDVAADRITIKDLSDFSKQHGIKDPDIDDLNQAKYLRNVVDDKKFNSIALDAEGIRRLFAKVV